MMNGNHQSEPQPYAKQEGPTIIIDRQVSLHRLGSALSTPTDGDSVEEGQFEGPAGIGLSLSSRSLLESTDESSPILTASPTVFAGSYGGIMNKSRLGPLRSIRFQVVIWYIGKVDVVLGRVPMKFRISIFWNDDDDANRNDSDSVSSTSATMWRMQGRRRASQVELNDAVAVSKTVDVPPVSILNAVSFNVIGEPEVNLLREDTKLMRWSCLYDAVLLQDNMTVKNFPHDGHDIILKLGILSQRHRGEIWDKRVWRLGLATEHDSKGTTRVPHGLIVDDVKIPEFHHDKNQLRFEFPTLSFGSDHLTERDKCLQIKLHVLRESGYYDQNIMPLLAALNGVALCIVYGLEASGFFMRGLLLLNIAFTQMGIRMTVDSHLPTVGYQIKMQRILNEFFFTLLFLVFESSVVYVLTDRKGWSVETTDWIDRTAVFAALVHTVVTVMFYYRAARSLHQARKA